MDMFVVTGGTPLHGRETVSGAKNAALPIMAASLLAEGRTVLNGLPRLVDVSTLAELLGTLGVRAVFRDGKSMRPEADAAACLELEVLDERSCLADYELLRRMRAGFCVLGPLLARRGQACVSLPGGCNIGDRPIDLHLKGLRALGADIRVERGYVIAEAQQLRGANIYLGGPFGSTVTGTCNVMSAAVLADGVTNIEAAACEPEVIDLGVFLNAMGARITGLGTPFLQIEGVQRLTATQHTVIADRIEAATLMIAAAMTRGHVELSNVPLDHMTAVIETLRAVGVQFDFLPRETLPRSETCQHPGHSPSLSGSTTVRVRVPGELRPVDCVALPYPGIPTDVQAQLTALLTGANGMSVVTERVFPDRFMHLAELVRMGASIRREGPTAIINGPSRLSGASVMTSDLRAGAALVIAALAAEGESVIRRIYHLDRGYEKLEEKLRRLGACISRTTDAPHNMPASLTVGIGNANASGPETLLKDPAWLRRQQRTKRPVSQ